LLDLNLAYLRLLICGQEPSRNSGAIDSELTRIEQSVEQIAEEMNALLYDDTLKERINATLWTLEESRKITDSEMSSEE
jgi:inorganic triphosphatase YgiF